ncbi:MAG: ABC transporter ATP-binding protein [Deltaproteobacteria bacterium]|nr:MAG: ABC transporter ATP-binding protein [Deltaproteobacteria bacterium]
MTTAPDAPEFAAVLRDVGRAWVRDGRAATVLAGLDMDLRRGAFASITGRSGSGKTTLLQIIGGLDRSYTGRVTVLGTDLASLADRQLSRFRGLRCGFIFQQFNLLPHLTVLQNVLLPTAFHTADLDSRERALSLLERVGLADRLDERPSILSGGQQQRVAIARALVQGADLLLCDEPTGSLDLETGNRLMDLFEELNGERGTTFLMVTHEPHIVERTRERYRLGDGLLHQEAG